MGHLKQYGKYFVFAAMSVTGVFVWNSQKRTISGEDAAELFNAAAERLVIPALTGSQTPTWPLTPSGGTNLFPSAVPTKEFRDGLQLLATRAMFGSTNVTIDPASESYPNGILYGVNWSNDVQWVISTNSLFDGSGTFVSSESTVALTPDDDVTDSLGFEWLATAVVQTNLADGALAVKTVERPGTMPFPDGVPLTNAPIWRAVWGAGKNASRLSFTAPETGCFWNTNAGRVAYLFHAQDKPLDRVFRLRDLLGPAFALSNLTTTVKNVSVPTVNRSVKIYDNSESLFGSLTPPLASVMADTFGGVGLISDTSQTNADPEWRNALYGYARWVDDGYSSPPLDQFATALMNLSIIAPTNFTAGQVLDYPSVYALTNGYVKRLRVYGIFTPVITHETSGAGGGLPAQPGGETNIVPYLTFDTHFWSTPERFSGLSFSVALSTFSTNGYTGEYNEGAPALAVSALTDRFSPRIALLHDVTDPTNTVSWSDIPTPVLTTMDPPSQPSLSWLVTDHPRTNTPAISRLHNEQYDRYEHGVLITFKRAFVIVDWKWKHLTSE
jgi:hypothetical protein